MRIAQICTRNVIRVKPDATVREAAELMRRHQVGSLVVMETGAGALPPLGIVTDRDIALSVVRRAARADVVRVDEIMSRPLVSCGEEEDIYDVLRRMHGKGVRRLPVLSENNLLLGIVTADDIVGALAAHLSELSSVDTGSRLAATDG